VSKLIALLIVKSTVSIKMSMEETENLQIKKYY